MRQFAERLDQKMGVAACARVHSEFNFNRVVEGVVQALQSLPQEGI
jgi:hypothetical protein